MTKISALSDIGTSVASNDTFVLVDVSDPTTPNKKIQQQNLFLIPDGSAGTPAVRFLNDTDVGLFRPTTNTLAFATGGSERLRIDSSGRVGIGTTSPGEILEVAAASGQRHLRVKTNSSTDSCLQSVYPVNGNLRQLSLDGSAVAFRTGSDAGTTSTEVGRWDSSGRLLVGTSSTSAVCTALLQNRSDNGGPGTLYLSTTTTAPTTAEAFGRIIWTDSGHSPAVQIEGGRDGGTWTSGSSQPSKLVFSTTADGASSPTERMRIGNTGRTHIYNSAPYTLNVRTGAAAGAGDYVFWASSAVTDNMTGGSTVFAVYTNGNVVNTNNSYGAISDIKLKENIVDASSQWDDLKALQVRNYNFKEGQTHTQIGLVAQEVELVSPGLVSESPDRDEEGNDLGTVTKSVNYSVLYMKAVKALQEAMERIEVLEAKVNALEGN